MLGAYRVRRIAAAAVAGMLVIAAAAFAQQTNGGIAGIARDTSGAVLPGVTVEASSSVLIERVRTATTDGDGRFNFVDLRAGHVRGHLQPDRASSTFKRDGIDADVRLHGHRERRLQVGSLEETITVSGASPVVDTQNVRRQTTATRDVLDGLPTSTKRIDTLVALTPGFTGVDRRRRPLLRRAGRLPRQAGHQAVLRRHGHREQRRQQQLSGQRGGRRGDGAATPAACRPRSTADGPVMNVVPKEGGNTFKFIGSGLWTNDKAGEQQPRRRPQGPRPVRPPTDEQDLRQRGERRRADQAGQDSGSSAPARTLGHGPAVCRPLLEQGAEHAALARRAPTSRS